MERFADFNAATTVKAGSPYTAGDGVLNVTSTAAPFPSAGNFTVIIMDATTGATKVLLRVSAVNSGTQWAVAAEGTDANAAAGDNVYAVLSATGLEARVEQVITAGAAGSLPAANARASGDIYLCSDAPMLFRNNGSSWDAYGPIQKFTVPVLTDFTAALTVTATVTDTGAGIKVSGSNNSQAQYYKAGTISNPTITIFIQAAMTSEANCAYGLLLRESSSGKWLDFFMSVSSNAAIWTVNKINADGSFNGNEFGGLATPMNLINGLWMRMRDDGTNRNYEWSCDGQVWQRAATAIGRTSFITVNQGGFLFAGTTNFAPVGRLLSYTGA